MCTGGTSQLLLVLQSRVKQFTLLVPGFQNRELNSANCALSEEANLSTVCGPQHSSKVMNTDLIMLQLSGSKYLLKASASGQLRNEYKFHRPSWLEPAGRELYYPYEPLTKYSYCLCAIEPLNLEN